MTRFTAIRRAGLASASLLALCAGAFTAQATETVEMNKTHLMRLPAPAAAIVIGNPKIADVSVHSDNTLFVMGRGFGETDILILNAEGGVLLHTDIRVIAPSSQNRVSVISPGLGRMSYDCSPYCNPAPVAGDDPAHIAKYQTTIGISNSGTATLSGPPSDQGMLSGGPSNQSEGPRIQNAESDTLYQNEPPRSRNLESSTRSFRSESSNYEGGKRR